MVFFVKKNFAFGTLASGITAGDTQVTLNAGHTLPTAGSFRALIWDVGTHSYPPNDINMEFVTATLNAGNVYNITRAQENTAAAAHSANNRMALEFTAGQITELEAEINLKASTAHKDTHKSGGSDAFVTTDVIEAVSKRLLESGGPTTLLMGVVADGYLIKRVGTNLVGFVPSSVRASQSAVQSIPSATPTRLNLDIENWDSNNEFTPGASHRYTASVAKKVEVYGVVRIVTSSPGDFEAGIYINGALRTNGRIAISTAGGRPTTATVYDQIELAINDYLDLYTWQGTGISVNTELAGSGSYLIVREI